jgi:hypothetical protein
VTREIFERIQRLVQRRPSAETRFKKVDGFVGDFWQEWNGHFRDDVRAFVRGDRGTVPRLASRVLGSTDIYGHEEREPERGARPAAQSSRGVSSSSFIPRRR